MVEIARVLYDSTTPSAARPKPHPAQRLIRRFPNLFGKYYRLGWHQDLLVPRRLEIKVAGVGGQGVASVGKILGSGAALEGKFVASSYSYGVGTRGGSSSSEAIISDTEIDYPFVTEADLAVVVSEKMVTSTLGILREGGLLVTDSDLVKTRSFGKNLKLAVVPAAKIADELGDKILTGTVALGALVKLVEPISKEALIESIRKNAPQRLREENVAAFLKGMDAVELQEGAM